jgi:hypothetical protein
MARGWESKSIEAQQEEAAARKPARPPVSAEDAERQRRRETLLLARTRALAQLQTACAPAYRSMLEQTIADIDAQLRES